MSRESISWWWLTILTYGAIAQIDCPDNTITVSNCTAPCGSLSSNVISYMLLTTEDYRVCPAHNGQQLWIITIENDGSTYCASNDETSLACVRDDGGLCIDSTMLSTGDSPRYITFYYGNRAIEIRYARDGVYAANSTVIVDQGSSNTELVWNIFDGTASQPTYQVFRKLDGEEIFTNVTDMGSPCSTDCSRGGAANGISYYCYGLTPQTATPGIHTYRLMASRGENGPYIGNDTITLEVIGITPTMTPSATISSDSPTSSITTTTSVTDTPTPTTDTLITAVVIPVAIVIAVVILLLIVMMIFGVCWYIRRQRRQRSTDSGDVPLQSPPQQGYIQPSGPVVPDTSGKYTGLYCNSKYSKSGDILKQKHGDLIRLLNGTDDINAARHDSNCSDVLIFSDIIDDIVKEVTSGGNPDHRSKVKIVQFVAEDKTPDNTLEIEGYKVVQYAGRPDDLDDLLSVVNKAEYPVAKSYKIDGMEDRSSVSSDRNSHFERTTPLEQTDTPLQSHNPVPHQPSSNPQSNDHLLLPVLEDIKGKLDTLVDHSSKNVEAAQETVKLQKDIRDQNVESNKHLGEINAHMDTQQIDY